MSRRAPGPQPWEAPRPGAGARSARRRSRLAWGAYALVLTLALASVVWRQSVGAERYRALQKLHDDAAVARAEHDELVTRILALSRRERIVAWAQTRLGMHVARDEEVVMLPVAAGADDAQADSGEVDR